MRYKLILSLALACHVFINVTGQVCPNQTDLNNTNVCGDYGDANGVSNWNWELNDPLNPAYCNNWYAKTGATGFLTRMGSPFVNPGTGKLKVITDNHDYTKEQGWELLQRKFGCQSDITYPYFILYNRYTSMMRVYVYLGAGTSYSQLLMTIKSVNNHRPAMISAANDIMYAPDKYLSNQAGFASDEVMVTINESTGTNQWAVSEFYMMLDNNIAESVYSNASLEISIYGVTNSLLRAVIEGTSCNVPTDCEEVKNAAFKTKNASTGGSSFNFTADGEKLLKLSKSFSDFIEGMHKNSGKIASNLYPPSSYSLTKLNVLQKFGKLAKQVKDNTADSADFANIVTTAGSIAGVAGNFLKFAGSIIGFLKGDEKSTASPAFTNYNFTLTGSISSQVVVQNLVLKIPGTSAPPTNANNATYYNCALGIFNLKKTPKLDTIAYDRRALLPASYSPRNVPKTIRYVAYKLHDDVEVMVNAGTGMTVVSVEGALMAKVVKRVDENPNPNTTVWIDPLENYPVRGYYTYFNHMRADVEANRLEITHYDVDNQSYHIIQIPFFPLECMKRASMNIHVPIMKIYLRIRATLKRTDGLGDKVYFIKDFELDKQPGNEPISLEIASNLNAIPPYSNYSIPPNTNAAVDFSGNVTVPDQDIEFAPFGNVTYSQPVEFKANHTIINSPNYYTKITSTAPIVRFRAGSSITLGPKFEASHGSVFEATLDWGYNYVSCNAAPSITNYTFVGNCYSSNIISQRAVSEQLTYVTEEAKIYPNPAWDRIIIKTSINDAIFFVKIIDMTGKEYFLPYTVNNGILQMDVSKLLNGSYVAYVVANGNILRYKFMILR